jgi:hypothetical protein
MPGANRTGNVEKIRAEENAVEDRTKGEGNALFSPR